MPKAAVLSEPHCGHRNMLLSGICMGPGTRSIVSPEPSSRFTGRSSTCGGVAGATATLPLGAGIGCWQFLHNRRPTEFSVPHFPHTASDVAICLKLLNLFLLEKVALKFQECK